MYAYQKVRYINTSANKVTTLGVEGDFNLFSGHSSLALLQEAYHDK